jgi:hypothetical protein
MSSSQFGIQYLWKDKKVEEKFFKALLEVSFESLEHQTKAQKDPDLKDCVFSIV